MAKAMGPFIDSHAPSWLSGPRTDVPTGPVWNVMSPCVYTASLEWYVPMRPHG
jgi:hypothetical protein